MIQSKGGDRIGELINNNLNVLKGHLRVDIDSEKFVEVIFEVVWVLVVIGLELGEQFETQRRDLERLSANRSELLVHVVCRDAGG